MRNLKSFVAMFVATLILGGGAVIYQVVGIGNEKAGDILVTTGQKLQKTGKAAQENPAGTANAQNLLAIIPTVVTKVATGQVATSIDITSSSASVADVQTPDVEIAMFGTSFSEPGKTFPALSGDETAYLTNLKREIGLNIVRAKGQIATSRAVAKQLGYELTESQILEVATALKGLSDDFAGLVDDSHAGPTQQKIDTLWGMHTGDGLPAMNIRVTRNTLQPNRTAGNAYLVDFEIDDKWVSASDAGINYLIQLANNKVTHNLSVNVIFALAANTEHNSEPLTSIYMAKSVMQSGKKISVNTSEIHVAPVAAGLTEKAAKQYLKRNLSVGSSNAQHVLNLN